MILVFFLNTSRKFGKMLSKDQVQMVASNQQAAGVFSAAAESRRSVPLRLSLAECVLQVKCSIKHCVFISVSQSKTNCILNSS